MLTIDALYFLLIMELLIVFAVISGVLAVRVRKFRALHQSVV